MILIQEGCALVRAEKRSVNDFTCDTVRTLIQECCALVRAEKCRVNDSGGVQLEGM